MNLWLSRFAPSLPAGLESPAAVAAFELAAAGITPEDRTVAVAAMKRQTESGTPAAAIELPDGTIVTGRTNPLLGAAASCLLNAIKVLAGIPHEVKVMSEETLIPIQTLKTSYMGARNPRLHTDEMLIALSSSASTNPLAKAALDCLPGLRGAEAHSSVILSRVDENVYRKLGIRLTCTPEYERGKDFV